MTSIELTVILVADFAWIEPLISTSSPALILPGTLNIKGNDKKNKNAFYSSK